jgi:hypothetical protein
MISGQTEYARYWWASATDAVQDVMYSSLLSEEKDTTGSAANSVATKVNGHRMAIFSICPSRNSLHVFVEDPVLMSPDPDAMKVEE